MAFLTPLPLTLHTRTTPSITSTHPVHLLKTMQPRATIAAPVPTDPTETPNQPDKAPWMPLPGIVHEIRTPEQYDRLSEVAKAEEKLLVIDFMAAWCRKCKYLLPRFRKIAGRLPDCYYCTVDVNKVNRLPREFGITKMPTFVFVRQLQRVHTIVGGAAPPKVADDLENAVSRFAE